MPNCAAFVVLVGGAVMLLDTSEGFGFPKWTFAATE
jgi:hypothetical protein